MALTNEHLGSVSTLVGAAMESAGHLAQSRMLDMLNRPGADNLAGLLFLISIIGAVITVAVGGSYRLGKWLLVGPAIYFFLIATRVPSQGASWRFADRERPMSEVMEATRGILDGVSAGEAGGTAGNVSYFFSVWDRLTSEVVQDSIALLRLTEDGSDLDFIAKTDRYLQLYGRHTNDPYLTLLLNLSLNNRCSNYFVLQWTAGNPDAPPHRIRAANRQLRAWGEDRAFFNLGEHQVLQGWVRVILQGSPVVGYVDQPMNCMQLWQLAVEVTRVAFSSQFIDTLVGMRLPREQGAAQARERLARKFGMRLQNGRVIQDSGVAPEQRLRMAINELTARIVLRELSQVRRNLVAMDMDEHPQVSFGEGGMKLDHETSRAIRALGYADEFQYKGEIIGAALTMPHVQGMILYFLAMTFPFFALVTMIPGRHMAIGTWMGLWLWAKLWDFGFAVVMMVDNILYALLPHGPPLNDRDLLEPRRALSTIFEVDPTYSAHTYYNLVACCLFAVPVVTGFLVHRSGRELVSSISEGFKEFPTGFGNSMASFQRGMMAQRNLGEVQKMILNQTMAASWDAIRNDSVVAGAFTKAAAIKFGAARAKEFENALAALPPEGAGRIAGALKGVGKDIQDLQGTAAQILYEQNQLVALSKLNANLHLAAYNASHSDYAVSRAAQAVGWMWNSHDLGHDVPGAELLMVEQAKQFAPWGQVQDAMMKRFLEFNVGPQRGGK